MFIVIEVILRCLRLTISNLEMSQPGDISMTLSDELDSIDTETGSESVAAVILDKEPTPRERTGSRRSWVWQWGIEEGRFWRCQLCIGRSKLLVHSATTHIISHLKSAHGKTETRGLRNVTAGISQPAIFSYRQLNRDTVIRLLVKWIVRTQQSFTTIESESFHEFISYINPYALQYVPKCSDTIRSHAQITFQHAKMLVKENLAMARSEIHYSFDLWTSPNCKAMLAIIGHWTAADSSLKTVLLGIREIHGRHTGSNIGSVLLPLFDELDIIGKLGYSVTDNAPNNDTALETLSASLLEKGIHYDVSSRRLRCIGHIINLVVKTLLFGAKAITDDTSHSPCTDNYDGAIAKLHHIVYHIRMTPQRRDLYASEQAASLCASSEFMVVADNATRWNSTYDMINSALKLRQRIDGYIRLVGKELETYVISDNEWEDLAELALMLVPFEKVTRATQGNNQGQGSIVSVLLSMDMLLSRLEKIKSNATSISSVFYSTVDAAWSKLNKYYSLTDRSPIYVVSIILHPCIKMRYFQRHWTEHPEWITAAREQMETFYMEYSGRGAPASFSESNSMRSEMDDWCFGDIDSQSQSELDEYLAAPVLTLRGEETMESFNPVSWYKSQNGSYPILTAIAYNIYAVPAMSAEAERVFSRYVSFSSLLTITAKQTITDRRNRLNTDTVEIIECLNSWQKEGILSSDIT